LLLRFLKGRTAIDIFFSFFFCACRLIVKIVAAMTRSRTGIIKIRYFFFIQNNFFSCVIFSFSSPKPAFTVSQFPGVQPKKS
jgi:hypothetical protein